MDSKNQTSKSGESRRNFIKKTASATAAVATVNQFKTPVYGGNQAPSPGRVIGANDRIIVGYVGIGGQGDRHVTVDKQYAADYNIQQAAVCEVSKTRLAESKAKIGVDDASAYDNYKKLLERKDIDVVYCSTVDHWHTQVTCDAMEAGKHVYVEKPMTRYLGEAFRIYDTAKRTGRLVQVGSQGSSDYKYHKAADLIQNGAIGPLVMLQGSYMRNSPKGEWNYNIQPWATSDDIDWKQWIAPVHNKIPFNADHYFRWRKYYPYCGGLLGDLVPHRLHPLMIATGSPEFPTRVVSVGNHKWNTDANTPGTPTRDVDEFVQLTAEFPSGMVLTVISSTVNQVGWPDMIRGHHATMYFSGDSIEIRPERPFADEVENERFDNLRPGESVEAHHQNFYDSIRSNKQPNAGIDLAIKVQTIISLAEMSDRLNIMCVFDEKSRKITTAGGKEVEAITYGSLDIS